MTQGLLPSSCVGEASSSSSTSFPCGTGERQEVLAQGCARGCSQVPLESLGIPWIRTVGEARPLHPTHPQGRGCMGSPFPSPALGERGARCPWAQLASPHSAG